MTTPNQDFRERGWTIVGAAVLAAVLAGAAGLVMATGGDAPRRREAVACAAAICLVGSLGGWLIARWPSTTPSMGVTKGLAAVALRIFLPLAGLGWLQAGGRDLREAGADRFLLVFYLALLATDVLLHMIGGPYRRGIGGKNTLN